MYQSQFPMKIIADNLSDNLPVKDFEEHDSDQLNLQQEEKLE